jgi:hypothetical protein
VSHPTCFLHVQKCGGQSLFSALEAALPPGSLAPRRVERANFCSFDRFESLGPEARSRVAIDDTEVLELASYRAVVGHFTLRTLKRLAPDDRIGTVLREPRARLVSYYAFLRIDTSLGAHTQEPCRDWRYEVHPAAVLNAARVEPIASDERRVTAGKVRD